jgi:hypothetical protein
MEAGTNIGNNSEWVCCESRAFKTLPLLKFEHNTNRAALSITLLLNNAGEVFESDMKVI